MCVKSGKYLKEVGLEMEVMTTYKVKIKESYGALKATVNLYRQAVDFLIDVSIKE